jgi:hypothetical protein
MKWTVTLSTLYVGVALAGCEATGDTGGTRTYSSAGVPVTFEVPTTFTREDVDEGNSRGDVVVAYGQSKVDVIALRRFEGALPSGPQRHAVLGKDVTSELHRVADGYALECQYTEDRADDVRKACEDAVASVKEQR